VALQNCLHPIKVEEQTFQISQEQKLSDLFRAAALMCVTHTPTHITIHYHSHLSKISKIGESVIISHKAIHCLLLCVKYVDVSTLMFSESFELSYLVVCEGEVHRYSRIRCCHHLSSIYSAEQTFSRNASWKRVQVQLVLSATKARLVSFFYLDSLFTDVYNLVDVARSSVDVSYDNVCAH